MSFFFLSNAESTASGGAERAKRLRLSPPSGNRGSCTVKSRALSSLHCMEAIPRKSGNPRSQKQCSLKPSLYGSHTAQFSQEGSSRADVFWLFLKIKTRSQNTISLNPKLGSAFSKAGGRCFLLSLKCSYQRTRSSSLAGSLFFHCSELDKKPR